MKIFHLHRNLTIFLLFIFTCFSGKTQDYLSNARQVGLPEGISHQVVYCFLQDSRGLIWVGTQYGLNLYDGYAFKQWTPIKDSLASSAVHYLLEDRAGYIWAITTAKYQLKKNVQGISLIDPQSGKTSIKLGVGGGGLPFRLEEVESFFKDSEHYLYFATVQGLYRYDGEVFTSLPKPAGVIPVALEEDGHFLGRMPGQLVLFDKSGQSVEIMELTGMESLNEFTNGKGVIWGKALPEHLLKIENDSLVTFHTNNYSFAMWGRTHLAYDTLRDWLWVGEETNLQAIDRQGHVKFDFQQAIPNTLKEDILGLFIDKNDVVWIGTRIGFYMLEIKPNPFTRYLYGQAENKSVRELYRCRGLLVEDGKLYANSFLGSMEVDLATGTIQKITWKGDTEITTDCWLIKRDSLGQAWLGNDELFKLDLEARQFENIRLPGDKYKQWDILFDQSGAVWAHTHSGLFRYENGQFEKMDRLNGFSAFEGCTVFAFHQMTDERIYIGTDRGLFLMDTERGLLNQFWPEGKNQQYLPAHQIQHIYEDADGYFWMATENEGIIRWHPDSFELMHLTRNDGLPSNTIYCIYEDEKGFLWMSSDFGIIRLNKKNLAVRTYLPNDGVTYHEFNRMSHFRATDGQLYFGSQNGVTAFYPKDFWEDLERDSLPPLQIYQYSEGHQFGARKVEALEHVKKQSQLEFTHDVRSLTFKLVPPDYFLADKISYYYKVETLGDIRQSPFLNQWVRSESNTINILGMVPGRYNISIEARGLDGERVAQPLEYEVYMAKPFFQTLLFRLLVLLATLGGIFAFFFVRGKRMKQRQIQLEQMVEERTQQILKDQQIIQDQEARIQQLDSLLNDQDGQWLRQVEELMQQNLTNFDLNIVDIADQMNISRTHFFRKMKSITGMTANQYLQEARLMEAKRLLEMGQYDTVKAVSLSVGFKKPSYFSSLFKERFGVSPSDFFNQN